MNILSERLAELRKDYGYTQDFISDFLNVTRSSVSNYETGINQPSIESLIKLADLYNVSLDYICGRTKEKVNLNLCDKEYKELILNINKMLNNYSITKK